MSERLLTPEEVATRLHVSKRYVWRLGREGKLPRVKLSHKCVRFRLDDVDAYIDLCARMTRPGATILEPELKPRPAQVEKRVRF